MTPNFGLITKPHAQDLLSHIDRLCQEAAGRLTGQFTARILQAFDHIEEHWAELSRQTVEDDHGEDFAAALRERAWLPAETSGRGLRRWPRAVAPESHLYRPDELFLSAQANLVASQCPVFIRARVKAEVQRGLGFLTSVPLDTVLSHFKHLLQLWGSAGRPGREPFEAALQDIYRYLGGFAKRPEAAAIGSRFAGTECLWCRGRMWLPAHVFRTRVPFFGDRRVTVQVKDAVRSAYQLLGMREKPCLADYLCYLEELNDEFGTQALPAGETERLLEVYRRIGQETGRDSVEEERFPLLTESDTFVDPQDAFYADAPWFQERIKHPRVQFLHRGLPVTVTQLPWVRSLAGEVTERPTGDWEPLESPEVQRRASKLEGLIRSQEFRLGIARLAYHEHGVYRSSIAGWLGRTRVVAVRERSSELVLTLDGEEVVVGAGPSDQYLDADGSCIYVDGNAGRLIRTFMSQAINSGLQEHRLRDLSPLGDILDCEPAEIDQTLTRLRIKPVDDEGAFTRPDVDAEESAPPDDTDEGPANATEPDENSGRAAAGVASSDDDGAGATAGGSPAAGHSEGVVTRDSSPIRPGPRRTPAATRDAREPTPRSGGPNRPAPGGVAAGRPTSDARPDVAASLPAQPVDDPGADGRSAPRAPAGHTRPVGQAGSRSGADGASDDVARRDGGTEESAEGSAVRQPGGRPRSAVEVRMGRRGGRRRKERRQRGKDRIVTYVSFGPSGDPANAALSLSEEERQERIALGDAAADLVCAFEREHGRSPTKLPHNHPGWDIDSFDVRRVESQGAAGALTRMIEVKGVRGPWTRQGVALSRRQFEASQQHGDRYWLYVVEFADDPARARIHPIHNPFAKINQFWFDSGWRQLADPAEAPSTMCQLTIGQRITVANAGEGIVERMEERGALKVVHVRLDSGAVVRKAFNPATMRPVGE